MDNYFDLSNNASIDSDTDNHDLSNYSVNSDSLCVGRRTTLMIEKSFIIN